MSKHNEIIKRTVNGVFLPNGFSQVGKSRTWLYDCGYCFVQVEFQPSAYSCGTYCNVGVAFLFEYFGQLNETLAFDFGIKRISLGELEFVEYVGDDEMFEAQVFQLAQNALKYAEKLTRFKSLRYGDWCLSKRLFPEWLKGLLGERDIKLYDRYNAAMIKFLLGQQSFGKRLMNKLKNLDLQSPYRAWVEKVHAEFCCSGITADEARAKVVSAINVRRSYFKYRCI